MSHIDSSLVCRFAPSPTGFLHVGGARTALYNWLLARHGGGKYLLRIEDTDLARSTQQAVDQLIEDLQWLGLDHDNAGNLMFQSRRLEAYNSAIDKLLAAKKAYKAYETPEELDAMRRVAEAKKQQFLYRRREIPSEQLTQFERENRPHVVRFAMPVKDYSFEDQILGKIDLPAAQCQDFVIRKADGMPTYHFAVVVDDAEMKITHVIRGQEHTLNTFLHLALQEALGYPRPAYAHLPVILNKDDGKKMGKRDRDKKIRNAAKKWMQSTKKSPDDLAVACAGANQRMADWLNNETTQLDFSEQAKVMNVVGLRESDLPEILIHDFRKNGYLPEALLNFLALVGWSPGGDRERMSRQEMMELFRLDHVHKAAGRFDREKLLAFNTDAVANASPDRLLAGLKDFLALNDSPLRNASDQQLLKLIQISAGFRTFRDLDDKCRGLLTPDDQIAYQPEAVEKVLKKNNGEGLAVLRELEPVLAALELWTHETIESVIKNFAESKKFGLGKVAQPIRVAVTGGTISPSIGHSLELIGKPATLIRMQTCLSQC
jgi:glutamyl/glutaminyl-tRNA synthetase